MTNEEYEKEFNNKRQEYNAQKKEDSLYLFESCKKHLLESYQNENNGFGIQATCLKKYTNYEREQMADVLRLNLMDFLNEMSNEESGAVYSYLEVNRDALDIVVTVDWIY